MPVPNLKDIVVFVESHIYEKDLIKYDNYTKAIFKGQDQLDRIIQLIKDKSTLIRKDINLISSFNQLGTRETVHYKSLYTISEEEMLSGKRYYDAIANGCYPVDVHHLDKPGCTVKYINGVQTYVTRSENIESRWHEAENYPKFWQVPYRALLNETCCNLIFAGRMINAEQEAFSALRVMIILNQLGEASGVAAYLAIKENCSFDDVNAVELRKLLGQGGSIVL